MPGATAEEKALLKSMVGLDIIRGASLEVIPDESGDGDDLRKVTHSMYYKFLNGEDVPGFVREKIMNFVHKRGDELNRMARKSKKSIAK